MQLLSKDLKKNLFKVYLFNKVNHVFFEKTNEDKTDGLKKTTTKTGEYGETRTII